MSRDISCQLTDNLTEIKALFYRKNYISKADDSHEMSSFNRDVKHHIVIRLYRSIG